MEGQVGGAPPTNTAGRPLLSSPSQLFALVSLPLSNPSQNRYLRSLPLPLDQPPSPVSIRIPWHLLLLLASVLAPRTFLVSLYLPVQPSLSCPTLIWCSARRAIFIAGASEHHNR